MAKTPAERLQDAMDSLADLLQDTTLEAHIRAHWAGGDTGGLDFCVTVYRWDGAECEYEGVSEGHGENITDALNEAMGRIPR